MFQQCRTLFFYNNRINAHKIIQVHRMQPVRVQYLGYRHDMALCNIYVINVPGRCSRMCIYVIWMSKVKML